MLVEFKFNLPDDVDEYNVFSRAKQYYLALWDIKDYLRNIVKYDDNLTDEQYKAVEDIYEKFFAIIEEHGIKEFD